jgi:hypothetical protein
MLVVILLFVIALVAWALHLMQQAVQKQEFSLMLAGTLVAAAAAGWVGAYLLTGNYVGYITHNGGDPVEIEQAYESIRWFVEAEPEEKQIYVSSSDFNHAR